MSNNYYCPFCKCNMNIGSSLVLAVKSPTSERGILFLETELGDYNKTTHPEFHLKEGTGYKFYCPACHGTLNKENNPKLVKLHMVDEKGKQCEINISNIIGENFTYQIADKKVKVYGPDAGRYRKYLDVPAEYQKYL